ncbi:MAG: RraA family protein [Trueperaceae bacterium]|nr:RraA family protein [Trueperaceae bacterium]
MISQTTLDKLAQYDTPTICNLIELFKVQPRTVGYMNERIQSRFPDMPPMVGFASPVTVRSAQPSHKEDGGYGWLEDHVERFSELSGPVVVVQQDLDQPKVAATFGEVMCSTYQAFGAVGLVSSGSGRDLEQVKALGFPVFTDGAICSHGYFHTVDIHIPINVGGIVVKPGDLLHGDANGVTTIPLAIVNELAEIADEFVEAENIIIHAMRGKKPSLKELKAVRAESKARVAEITKKIGR